MSEWVSVKKQWPPRTDKYLCRTVVPNKYGGGRTIEVLELYWNDYCQEWNCSNRIVTHWTHCIPEPKEDDE